MKKLWHFLREYKQFSWTLVAAIAGLGLELGGNHLFAHILLSAAAIASVVPLLWGMVQDLRSGTYGVDILAATAIVTAVIMRQYWAAIVIVLMLTGGESLEDYAEHRAERELDDLLTRAPQQAHVLRGRKTVDVPVSEVQVGDKLLIKPGELVPVDAVILEGSGSFDESSLTGESLPRPRDVGALLLSGSVDIDGAVTVRAAQTAKNSQYEQIIKLVRAAQNSKAPFVRLADRYAVPFTLLSFTIALAAWFLSHQSIRFLEVLVVATPCPLILAAPIAIISGMSRASRHGIIIKNGSSLEKLAAAQTFAFDKTGTLTQGKLRVDGVKAYNGFTADEVLAAAASLERNSVHIIAQAIVAQAEKKRLRIPAAKRLTETAGNGLEGLAGGKQVLVGRLSFLQKQGVELPKTFQAKSVQQTAALVAIGGKLAGVISFIDDVREETKPTLERLRELGVKKFLMVTGDNQTTAKLIARKLGIKDVRADTLPGDKLLALEAITDRPVAFVGDGVNDAPVLTAADVGIALGARGSTAASESADVVLMQDDLSYAAVATSIAKRTFFIARQSIVAGILLSIVLMAIFATGKFKPLYGAVLQEVVDVVVIFNALRAHSGKKP
ncbi:MAG TPA: heavy metal translocating P-type ATPase [Candidatus Saccharimonadales bacterium]|nr:heavy metal translocating P-type ATPase [Candidatus Saccharimonadales bacterium]